MMAKEGLAIWFYIGFATFLFLIPGSFVSAELGGMFNSDKGGVYTWVKEAFGSRWGFAAVWLQWIQNVVWYPVVLGFAAATLTYLIGKPHGDAANRNSLGSICRPAGPPLAATYFRVGKHCLLSRYGSSVCRRRGSRYPRASDAESFPRIWGCFLAVAFSLVVFFFPPTQIPVGLPTLYKPMLVVGLVVFGGAPFVIHAFKKSSWATATKPPSSD